MLIVFFFLFSQLLDEELDADLEKEASVIEAAEKIMEKMSSSGSEKVMDERMQLERHKKTIKIELEQRMDTLKREKQKWKSYFENKKQFEDWLKATEKDLTSLSTAAIDLETPARFQVFKSAVSAL